MGSKGSNTTTTSTTNAPAPQAMQAYSDVLNQAQGVAGMPYAPYTGEGVAPFNAEQNMGVTGFNQYANAAQPNLGIASTMTQNASNPLTAAQINSYMNPYTQDVVNATQAQFNNQNQQQLQGVKGNAIAQGALGGNREGIAEAETANQQQLAQAPIIAGLENQGYQTGLNTATQQYQTNPMAAAAQLGNLGVAGQTAGLQGAAGQLGAGSQQQTTQQALDTYLAQQYAQQQAYPFQTTQWLAGLDTGVGSQMGGTSSGTTTAPAPNPLSQIFGGISSGVGLLGATGAFGNAGWLMPALAGLARGGVVEFEAVAKRHMGGVVSGVGGYASGGSVSSNGVAGMPWASAPSWIPGNNIAHGSGAPPLHAPAPYQVPQNPLASQASSIGSLAKNITQGLNGPAYGGGSATVGDAYGGSSSNPLAGLNASDYGPGFAKGGVAGFDDGGVPTFDDRFSAAFPNGVNLSDGPAGIPASQINDSSVDTSVYTPDNPLRIDSPDQRPEGDPANMPNLPGVTAGANPAVQSDEGIVPSTSNLNTPIIEAKSHGVAPKHALAFSGDTDSADDSNLPPEVALGYSGGPRHPYVDKIAPADGVVPSSGFDWSSNNKLWPSLISAGFGMLASRSPFFGNAIGEGGQAGVNAYNAQLKAEQDAKQHAEQLSLEHERIEKPYSEMTANERAVNARAIAAQKSADEQKDIENAIKLKTPIQIRPAIPGQYGTPDQPPLMAMPRINPNTSQIDLYPIMPDGTISDTPLGRSSPTGSPVPAPAAPTVPQPPGVVQSGAAPTAAAVAPTTAAGTPVDNAAPPASPNGRDENFLNKVQSINPAYASLIKKVADYEADPATIASMRGLGKNGESARQKLIQDAMSYDHTYSPAMMPVYMGARKKFYSGATSDQIASYNTAISHLDTLRDLYRNLGNTNSQTWNKIANTFKQEFGYAAPTDVNAAKQIVGAEVIKAVVGSQNALGDRDEIAGNIKRDLAAGQVEGVINTYQRLMLGQLESKRLQYETTTHLHNFDSFLNPHTEQVFARTKAEEGIKPIPSRIDFLERARAANPGKSDQDLLKYYDKTYGPK